MAQFIPKSTKTALMWINADTCIRNAEIAYEDSTEDDDGPVDTVISSGDLGVLIDLAHYAVATRATPPAMDHCEVVVTLSEDAIRQGEGKVREWPDIGDDPMKSRPYEDRMAVSADAIRKAYTVQQPIVPDQTALVWRWHLGALLEAEIQLRSILADEPATPASHASDGGTSNA